MHAPLRLAAEVGVDERAPLHAHLAVQELQRHAWPQAPEGLEDKARLLGGGEEDDGLVAQVCAHKGEE
jgi:hypothetical protein